MNRSIKILLLPFSFLYGIITGVRNALYDWKILRETKFEVRTIGVGNLAVGGAGKTPLVEYLIRLLSAEKLNIATLSRGYKRKTRGFVLADQNSDAHEIGDEPLIYKTKYPIRVAVDGNRVRGVRILSAIKEQTPEVILLDDVFQHRALKCGLNILVTDFNNLFCHDYLMPAGTLRESRAGMDRADIIIVSKTPDRTGPVEMRNITRDIKPKAHQKVFFSFLQYGELYSIHDREEKLDTLNDLFRYRVISFAGIANADPFINYLKEYSAELRHLPFPDHYDYSLKDLGDIEKYYHSFKGGNKILVTTEKDLMRLRNPELWDIARSLNIYILPVEVSFGDKEEEFNALVMKYVRTDRIHHQKYS